MPTLYKSITAILALTGCISLFMTGWMNPLMSAGGLSIFAGYYRFFRNMPQASKRAAAILAQAALAVFLFDAFTVSRDVFLAVAHMTITFQGIKSFDLKEPWDHLQVYFMTLLQLIIASEMTSSLAFGVIFMAFVVLLVSAMVLSHFLKEGTLGRVRLKKPVIAIVMLTMICTVMLFIIIPRTPYRSIGKSHHRGMKTVGFSGRVDFGSFGSVKLDPSIVMRVEFNSDVRPPYYWRGVALDYFDGTAWRNTETAKYRIPRAGDEFIVSEHKKENLVEQRIFLEPLDSDVVFGLPRIVSIRADIRFLGIDSDMAIYMPEKLSRRITYTVLSDMSSSVREGGRLKRYLQLPDGMERISSLAKRISSEAVTAEGKAASIESFLNSGFAYSLETAPPRPGMSIIEDFLFESKKGYCEHYSSSMVLMLRSLGIPSRVVTGFGTGEKNEYGNYVIVRQSDAHAWVEAYINNEWRRFDPTPSVAAQKRSFAELYFDSIRMQWMRYVIGFNFDDQKAIAKIFTIPFRLKELPELSLERVKSVSLAFLILAAVVSISFYIMSRLKTGRYAPATQMYLDFRSMLKRRGISITDSMTSADIKRALSTTDLKEIADEFLDLYERHRFGGQEMSSQDKTTYRNLLSRAKYKE